MKIDIITAAKRAAKKSSTQETVFIPLKMMTDKTAKNIALYVAGEK